MGWRPPRLGHLHGPVGDGLVTPGTAWPDDLDQEFDFSRRHPLSLVQACIDILGKSDTPDWARSIAYEAALRRLETLAAAAGHPRQAGRSGCGSKSVPAGCG
jgi:hypothetical protein